MVVSITDTWTLQKSPSASHADLPARTQTLYTDYNVYVHAGRCGYEASHHNIHVAMIVQIVVLLL